MRCVAAKRLLAGEALVEHDAHRKQVAPRVGRPALQHLWRHVGGRPRHAERLELGRGPRVRLLVAKALEPRDAEVKELWRPRGGDHDVLRLQVAVDHAAPVGDVERRSDSVDEVEGRPHAERTAPQPRRQRLALHVLHGDEVATAFVRPDLVD